VSDGQGVSRFCVGGLVSRIGGLKRILNACRAVVQFRVLVHADTALWMAS